MAVIEFDDGTKIVLKRNSSITFEYGGFTINNGSGSMTYRKIGSNIILKNKRAKFGILGTTVAWEETDSKSVFQVLEGNVEAENKKTGEKTLMQAGDEYVIDSTEKETIGKIDIEEEINKWKKNEEEAEKSTDTNQK